jgi:predicted Zn-dependent protease
VSADRLSPGRAAPDGIGPEPRTDLAARVLDRVAAATGGAAAAEVTVVSGTLALTRFANSFIHQNVAETADTVRLRLHLDGRTASSTSTVTAPDGLDRLVEQTLSAARLRPVDTGWAGLTAPAPPSGAGRFDTATAGSTPADRAAVVRAFVDAAGGLETAGFCRVTASAAAYANSAGHALTGHSTMAAADGIARTGSSDGMARAAAISLGALDGAALGSRAAAKARDGADPGDLGPGRYEVVLEPTAVADVLEFLCRLGFNARAVAEGRSFAAVGEEQFDPAITLVDDPLDDAAPGAPFDAEGTPKRPLDLVTAGVTAAVAHDRRTARQLGAETTGHAIPGGERVGAIPLHPRLRPGTGADLVAGVERGLLVTDLWYTRVLDPRTLVVTGLTRNGVWLVENGRLVRPLRNLRFTQSYLGALAPGKVRAVGAAAETVPSIWLDTSVVTPGLHLASWNFTGGAGG